MWCSVSITPLNSQVSRVLTRIIPVRSSHVNGETRHGTDIRVTNINEYKRRRALIKSEYRRVLSCVRWGELPNRTDPRLQHKLFYWYDELPLPCNGRNCAFHELRMVELEALPFMSNEVKPNCFSNTSCWQNRWCQQMSTSTLRYAFERSVLACEFIQHHPLCLVIIFSSDE